ncbi:MAG: galactose oxidase early set domain-containing protein [Polaromonas sp.]|uniref:galactose oxidase early set domain-containing protein n=1 Tax=Polaromonas sp. TaxID=1869339 RepID=UPI002732A7B6|nr:galactose oxidase early set domain-containing protein [Polaromonas sp.]MDP2818651.1 galactose oxidase early set domain-containing protein [Polaromonas sp.]
MPYHFTPASRPIALSSAFFLANLLAMPLASLAQTPSASHAHARNAKACQPADIEAKKHRHETETLGARHADQHAHMRLVQCEVERGVRKVPAKGILKSADQTLKDDEAAKQAAFKTRKGKPADLRGLGGGSALAEPGGTPTLAAAAAGNLDPATMGRWSDPFIIPVVGVAAVLLHTGNVMFWSYDPVDYHNPANSKNGVAFIWNPSSRTGYNIPPPENVWCAGQTILSDGRVYLAGGNLRYPDPNAPGGATNWAGTLTNYTFNPLNELWAKQPDMVRGRWYPTVTQLADNRVVITSGMDETGYGAITNAVEVLTPDPNIDGIGTIQVVSTHNSSGLYPLQFLLPSGQMLEAGPNAASSFQLNPATWNWSGLPRMKSDHYYLGNGISYTDASPAQPRQLIMVAGGHTEKIPLAANEWLDGFNPALGWKTYPQWQTPRHNANTVILPDGTLLTVGGNKGLYGYEDAEFSTELYSKAAIDTTGTWLKLAPHTIQAAYHSTAILLPDATVLLSQDDMDYSAQAAFQHKAQVYSPPYLFKGPQPKITAAPTNVAYGQSFNISTDRSDMVSAVLVAPGATTHGNDMHQRAIKLRVQPRTNGLTATVPSSSALVPPGYYMLFVMDSQGIPSVAKFVRVT